MERGKLGQATFAPSERRRRGGKRTNGPFLAGKSNFSHFYFSPRSWQCARTRVTQASYQTYVPLQSPPQPKFFTGFFASRVCQSSVWWLILKMGKPYWLFPGSAKIERHVPVLPFSRDVDRFNELRRALTIYRMVFGQSRQEDLMTYLLSKNSPRRSGRKSWPNCKLI